MAAEQQGKLQLEKVVEIPKKKGESMDTEPALKRASKKGKKKNRENSKAVHVVTLPAANAGEESYVTWRKKGGNNKEPTCKS